MFSKPRIANVPMQGDVVMGGTVYPGVSGPRPYDLVLSGAEGRKIASLYKRTLEPVIVRDYGNRYGADSATIPGTVVNLPLDPTDANYMLSRGFAPAIENPNFSEIEEYTGREIRYLTGNNRHKDYPTHYDYPQAYESHGAIPLHEAPIKSGYYPLSAEASLPFDVSGETLRDYLNQGYADPMPIDLFNPRVRYRVPTKYQHGMAPNASYGAEDDFIQF